MKSENLQGIRDWSLVDELLPRVDGGQECGCCCPATYVLRLWVHVDFSNKSSTVEG